MTALDTAADSARNAARTPQPPAPAWATDPARPLIDRLAARISSGLDEVSVFPSPDAAADAVVSAIVQGRRAVVADPANEYIAARARRSAGGSTAFAWTATEASLDGLVAAARDAEVVVLSSPLLSRGSATSPESRAIRSLGARDLLRLRSRAPRPVLVLDLRDEDLASSPLTQTALLLPGTIVVRGFGAPWREAGAAALAPLAFVAGPADLIDLVGRGALGRDIAEAACAELDRPEIEPAVRSAALRWRQNGLSGASSGGFLAPRADERLESRGVPLVRASA
ncbi:MAG: hypothetical protein ACO3QC_13440 [Phycisphaerales bacterium]